MIDYGKYFTEEEFRCRCGRLHGPDFGEADMMDQGFVNILNELRDDIQQPVIISSGWRCLEHPREIGKRHPGPHCSGRAADIVCFGSLATEILKWLYRRDEDFGIGIDQRGSLGARFIHVDTVPSGPYRTRPTVWTY